jgi:hypothetical protein
LERQVSAFLAGEAASETDAALAGIIRGLPISEVQFFRQDHPHTFAIVFEGPEDFNYWRCESTDGVLGGLDWD